MPTKTLLDLFTDQLKDTYYAERKILKALPKMARGAMSAELKKAFETHREQTEEHVARLQEVFEILGRPARGKTCPAIDGILEEGEEVLDTLKGASALDAGLIASAQAVEHYEMARYGTLVRWAEVLQLDEASAILKRTLDEEKETDRLLTQIADETVNEAALAAA
jgi:ferritin-like metal-binding protein YciE